MEQVVESAPVTSAEEGLAASVQKSGEAWRRLGMRLRSLTPGSLARILLVVGALASVGWVLNRSLAPLAPFLIGLALAYITAPLV
jgi:hypothetical protein